MVNLSVYLLMAFINRIFFVNFNQFTLSIVNFLMETDGLLVTIHFFNITRSPAMPPGYIQPIATASIG